MEMWKMVNDIDRRDIYDDVVVQLAKKEKVTFRVASSMC